MTAAVPDPRFRDQLAQMLLNTSLSSPHQPNSGAMAIEQADALLPLIAAEVEARVQAAANQRAEAIDVEHLERQREWSQATFVIDHIRKELVEIEEAGERTDEWFDVVILALDGAWRDGHEAAEIIAAIKAKQAENERRTWPDWRTADPDRAIEHVRAAALAQPAPEAPTKRAPAKKAPAAQPVVDLMSALRRSVERVGDDVKVAQPAPGGEPT